MTTPPDNYDAYTIGAAPCDMYYAAFVINDSATNISTYLSNIINSLSSLRLSWTGTGASAASLAQEFNTRWANAATALFGTQNDPSGGILNQLISGLVLAAQNYNGCEHIIASMFSQYGSAGSAGSPSAPADVRDEVTNSYYHTTSVDETF